MGLAVEIDVSLTASPAGSLIVAAPYGSKHKLSKYRDGVVLLLSYAVSGPECIGSAVLKTVLTNEYGSDNELITLIDIRWLADPRPFVSIRSRQKYPWAVVPIVEFGLLLGKFNANNSWAAARSLVPIEGDISHSLAQEIIRTANGRCQLTDAVTTPEEPVVVVPIRNLSEGGDRLPGNFLAVQRCWRGPFANYYLSVGLDRRLVVTTSRIGQTRMSKLNANGYLSVPKMTHRDVQERNLTWHFEHYIDALRWPMPSA